jgi:flagellar motor protein MotB
MKFPVVYVGLFLIAFALYAAEAKKPATVITMPAPAPKASIAKITQESKLAALQSKLTEALTTNALPDGILMVQSVNRYSGASELLLRWSGDDMYAAGDFAIRETWYTLIDRMAAVIQAELKNGLEVEIRGYADSEDPVEKSPSDYGKSAYAFSFARAEWLARYLERKDQIEIEPHFQLKGMGASESGRKIIVAFTYP